MSPPRGVGDRGSLMVAAGIALSRVTGLLREVVLAAFLGSGVAANAFAAAFRIPNLMQNLLGEGVLSASFIPSYSRLLAEGRTRAAATVAGTVLTLLLGITGLLVLLGVVAAGPLTSVIAPGLTGQERDLTVTLVMIMTPGIGLLVASAWCLGVLNSHRRFFLSYVAPVLLNAAQIVALLVAGLLVFTEADVVDPDVVLSGDARGLAVVLGWATVVGAALQLGIQVPEVRRLAGRLRPSVTIDPETRTVLQRFTPVVGARGVVQISAFLELALASFLVTGAIASLRYGQTLYLLPISLFGMSIAASELPAMSSELAAQDRRAAARAVGRRLRAGLSRIAFFVVPIAVAFVAAGDLVVGALLQRGEFTRANTVQVWAIVGAYGLGLVAATASRLLQSALYGLGDTRTPARASLVRVAVSLTVGVVLMIQLDRVAVGPDGLQVVGSLPAFAPLDRAVRSAPDALPRLGAAGLALGAAAAAWVELRILRARLARAVGPIDPVGGVLDPTAAGSLAAVAVTIVGRLVLGDLPPLVAGVLVLGAAGVAYLIVTRMTGFPFVRATSGRGPRRPPPRHARSATARRSRRGNP